jgi:hypothetical protein
VELGDALAAALLSRNVFVRVDRQPMDEDRDLKALLRDLNVCLGEPA